MCILWVLVKISSHWTYEMFFIIYYIFKYLKDRYI